MRNSTSTHVLVTGGAGFIGSHLVDRLLREGHAVTVLDDCSTGNAANLESCASHPQLRIIREKVSRCANLDPLVAESSMIYHLAAAVGVELVVHSPVHTIETNLHETEAILGAAARCERPILITSTSEVYGRSQKAAFSEEDDLIIGPPHLGRWSYACSKLMDEFLALAYAKEKGLPVIITRLFNTVGPRQTGRYGMVLPRFVEAALAGLPLRVYGDGSQTRCFCFVGDTVEALLRLPRQTTAIGGVFNVGSTEEISILQLAELVIRKTNSSSAIEFVPYSAAYAPGFQDMQRRKPVTARLKAVTGFAPATPLESIVDTILLAR